MTTDITERALTLRLEVHRAVSNLNPQMNVKTRDLKELVEALEKAQKSNEFLKGQLSELANFNPDWDKLEASYDSWREIAAELLVAKERIAELESRTVTVKLTDINEYLAEVHDKTLNRALRLLAEGVRAGDVAAMRASGIKVEAE